MRSKRHAEAGPLNLAPLNLNPNLAPPLRPQEIARLNAALTEELATKSAAEAMLAKTRVLQMSLIASLSDETLTAEEEETLSRSYASSDDDEAEAADEAPAAAGEAPAAAAKKKRGSRK